MSTAAAVLQALHAYDLKKEREGQYRANNPMRYGSNSHALALTIHDDEHGTWFDHVENTGGSLYELATALAIPLPERPAAEVTKRAYSGLPEYAAAHGVSADVFSKAKWREAHHEGRPALIFDTPNGERVRFIDGNKPHFKHIKQGYTSCWYGLRRAVDMATKLNMPVVLCNGEPSTVVAQAWGIPAACITSSGEKNIPDALLQEFNEAWTGAVLIALDCDSKGQVAAAKMAAQLPGAVVVDLGFDGGSGGDLADFTKLYSADSMPRLLEYAKRTTKSDPFLKTGPETDTSALLKELANLRKGNMPSRESTLQAIRNEAERELRKTRTVSALAASDMAQARWDALLERRKNPTFTRGLLTNCTPLDNLMRGFRPGWFITLLGATNMGKSAVFTWMMAEFSTQGRGLLTPTETDADTMYDMIWCARADVPYDTFDAGSVNQGQLDDLELSKAALEESGLYIMRTARPYPSEVREACLQAQEANRPFDFLGVDSLSNMTAGGTPGSYEDQTMVSHEIQAITLDYHLCTLATVQIGRAMKEREDKQPRLNDAKGSGDIEQDSTVVLGYYRHDYYVALKEADEQPLRFPKGTAQLMILKHKLYGHVVNGKALTLRKTNGKFDVYKGGWRT